jgi:hypothetical protein
LEALDLLFVAEKCFDGFKNPGIPYEYNGTGLNAVPELELCVVRIVL